MLDASQPIRAKLGHGQGTRIYELAVPLAKAAGSSDGLGVQPGAVIGIGLETPESAETPTASRDGRGGGMGGRGGANSGPGGASAPRLKPLEIWTTVQLATPSAPR